MRPGPIKDGVGHFAYAGHDCASCGKKLVEGDVYTIIVPMLPEVVTEESLFCSGCAVATAAQHGGTTAKVLLAQAEPEPEAAPARRRRTRATKGKPLQARGKGKLTSYAKGLADPPVPEKKEKSDG